jgi:hypothetical protein
MFFVVVVHFFGFFFFDFPKPSLPEKEVRMFGRMSAIPLVRLDAGEELEVAVAELLAATEYPDIGRWIQFPRGLMLFLLVPGDAGSGAVYVYDRCDGIWFLVDFQDQNYGGYSLAELGADLQFRVASLRDTGPQT